MCYSGWKKTKGARKGNQREKTKRSTDVGMKNPKEGGFGSNHKVASCGEKSNSVRTNRPSPRGIVKETLRKS